MGLKRPTCQRRHPHCHWGDSDFDFVNSREGASGFDIMKEPLPIVLRYVMRREWMGHGRHRRRERWEALVQFTIGADQGSGLEGAIRQVGPGCTQELLGWWVEQ